MLVPRESAAGSSGMERRAGVDIDWFQEDSVRSYPIFGSILGALTLVCIYFLWRGPHRRKFPCVPRRRSSVSSDTLPSPGSAEKVPPIAPGFEWVDASRRSNLHIVALRQNWEARQRAQSGGQTMPSPTPTAVDRRKITKSPKSPRTPASGKTFGHGRSPTKASHAVSAATTTSSFGHAPDQYHASWISAGPVKLGVGGNEKSGVETLEWGHVQARIPETVYSAPLRTPYTPYSPPSAYPATPPAAYVGPSGSTSSFSSSSGSGSHFHPYPVFGSSSFHSTSTPALTPTSVPTPKPSSGFPFPIYTDTLTTSPLNLTPSSAPFSIVPSPFPPGPNPPYPLLAASQTPISAETQAVSSAISSAYSSTGISPSAPSSTLSSTTPSRIISFLGPSSASAGGFDFSRPPSENPISALVSLPARHTSLAAALVYPQPSGPARASFVRPRPRIASLRIGALDLSPSSPFVPTLNPTDSLRPYHTTSQPANEASKAERISAETASRRQSLSSTIRVSSVYIAAPPPARVKRASGMSGSGSSEASRASVRASTRSLKGAPSPLRQSTSDMDLRF